MNNTLYQDTASKFFRPQLTADEQRMAVQVSPYFLAYLQGKIEAYATALVDTSITYDPDPAKQVTAIVAFERSRAFIQAYEELLSELLDAQSQDMESAKTR
jgi:hypothetical protein